MINVIYLVLGVLSFMGMIYSYRGDLHRWREETKYGNSKYLVYLLESIGGGLFNGAILFAITGIFFFSLSIAYLVR
jgi:hypothetical protein